MITNPDNPELGQLVLYDGDYDPSLSEATISGLDPATYYWFYVVAVSSDEVLSDPIGTNAATASTDEFCYIDISPEMITLLENTNPGQQYEHFFQYDNMPCVGCGFLDQELPLLDDSNPWNYYGNPNSNYGGGFDINLGTTHTIHALHLSDDTGNGVMNISFLNAGNGVVASIEFMTTASQEWVHLTNFIAEGVTKIRFDFVSPSARLNKIVICGSPSGGEPAGDCITDNVAPCNENAGFTVSACELSVHLEPDMEGMTGIWNMGDGSMPFERTGAFDYTYAAPGEYEITFTTENPCLSVCEELVVLPVSVDLDADFTFDDPGCNPLVNFVAAQNGWNHSWEFRENGTLLGQSMEANPSFNFSGPGTYEVIHTISFGNCAPNMQSENLTIDVCTPNIECSPVNGAGALYVFGDVNSSDIGGVVNPDGNPSLLHINDNDRIEINGTVTIDDYTWIYGGTWFMNPGSRILVPNGHILELSNVTFQGCDGMWDGIQVESGATIYTNDVTSEIAINDALVGISLLNPNYAAIRWVSFDKNFIGIYAQGVGTRSIRECTFNCSGDLLARSTATYHPSINATFPEVGQESSYAGVFTRNQGSLDIRSNVIRNMANGIVAEGAGVVRLSAIQMTNITRGEYGGEYGEDETNELNFSGYGVIGLNTGSLRIAGGQTDITSPSGIPEMDNVVDGIFLEDTNSEISDAWLTNVNRGVIMEMSDQVNLDVSGSVIQANNTGIRLAGNMNISLLIDNNSIESGNPGEDQTYGIELREMMVGDPTQRVISNNIINATISGGDSHGLFFNNTAFITTQRNDIQIDNQSSSSTHRYGVATFGGSDLLFDCNQVFGTETNIDVWKFKKIIGFGINNTPNATYECNRVQRTSRGFSFDGDCLGTDLITTSFNRHWRSLELGADARIGPQSLAGNTWAEDPNDETVEAFYDGDNTNQLFESSFEINQTGCASEFWPCDIENEAGPIPAGSWFNFVPGDDMSCTFNLANCGVSVQENIPADPCNPIGIAIMNNQITSDNYPVGIPWLADRWLYGELTENELSLDPDCDGQYENYLTDIAVQTVGKLQQLTNRTEMNYLLDNYLKNLLSDLEDEIDFYKNKVDEYTVLIAQSTSASDSSNLELDKALFMEFLWKKVKTRTTITQELKSGRITRIDNLTIFNESLNTNFAYEKNEQIINSLFYRTITLSNRTVNATEKLEISNIAKLCPLVGGPSAVYRARALANILKVDYIPDDCTPAKKKEKEEMSDEAKEFAVNIQPNPANTEVQVQYKLDSSDDLKWKLYNLTGQLLYQSTTTEATDYFMIDLVTYPKGIYLLTTEQDGILLNTERLIIQ